MNLVVHLLGVEVLSVAFNRRGPLFQTVVISDDGVTTVDSEDEAS